jgi:hypothetical protein
MTTPDVHIYGRFVLRHKGKDSWNLLICQPDALKRIGLNVSGRVTGENFDPALLSSRDFIMADWGHGFQLTGNPLVLRFRSIPTGIDVETYDGRRLIEVFRYEELVPISAAAAYIREQIEG